MVEFDQIMRANIELKTTQRQLQAMNKGPISRFRNRKKIKKLQALEEAQRDILNTTITNAQATSSVIDKNNYKTYVSQVSASYDMFNNKRSYGGEFFRGILETRVAFICGQGLSVIAKRPATREYIDKFLKASKLYGSQLIKFCEIGELEGKNLIILYPDIKNKVFKTSAFSWWENQYTVEMSGDEFLKAVYRDKKTKDEKIINGKRSAYIKIGGTYFNIDETTNRIHCVLTDIENASRAKYDLRKNSHLFGRITPYWKTTNRAEADSINKDVASSEWEIGTGYAGTAEYKYVEPSGGAAEQIIKDMLSAIKAISSTTGIPIHWLAWPELMSNRATAENMLETIAAATRKERLIWEEAFTEIISKSMDLAIDAGFEDNSIKSDFEVKLPLISTTLIKQLSETWLPLQQMDVISMETLRNKIPDVNPLTEVKLIDKEKENNIKTLRDSMNNSEDKEEDTENE